MTNWKEYRFSDFVAINPPVSLKGTETYPFVEMKDLQDGNKFCTSNAMRKAASGARFRNGDTLFARITPCLENGKICQVRELKKEIGFGSTEFLVFRGRENISDNDFVYYLSRWDETRSFAESNFEGSSGRQRVPKDCFDKLVLKLPLLPEQKQIAEILSSLDDKIDLLHRQNKTLEALAETLFRQWFVEEAEEGRTVRLGEISRVATGKGLKRSEFLDNGSYPVLGSNGEIGRTDKYLTDKTLIITGRVGTLGEVKITNGKVWISDNVLIVAPSLKKHFYPIYFTLKSVEFENLNVGSTQPLVTQTDLKQIPVNLKDDESLKNFERFSEDLFARVDSNNNQVGKLVELRNILLPMLMSGAISLT